MLNPNGNLLLNFIMTCIPSFLDAKKLLEYDFQLDNHYRWLRWCPPFEIQKYLTNRIWYLLQDSASSKFQMFYEL